jgi:hypothetical protein
MNICATSGKINVKLKFEVLPNQGFSSLKKSAGIDNSVE